MSYLTATGATPAKPNGYTLEDIGVVPITVALNDTKHYALLISNNSNALCVIANEKPSRSTEIACATPSFSVNDCVQVCQDVLGLKINEIAKLTGFSRASLDLHRKGANLKDVTKYDSLYHFIMMVDHLYGNSLKNHSRNILVDRKTLVQHLIAKSDDLMSTIEVVDEIARKAKVMRIAVDSDLDRSKTFLRTRKIGKMA